MKRAWSAFIVPVVLLALLAVLSVMQYRWIGENSRAERERVQAAAEARAKQLAEDFDNEVTAAWVAFYQIGMVAGSDPVSKTVEHYKTWLSTTRHPHLVREVLVMRFGDKTPQLFRIGPDRVPVMAQWPAQFGPWVDRFEKAATGHLVPSSMGNALIADLPAGVTSFMNLNLPPSGGLTGFRFDVLGFGIVWFDRAYLEQHLLPQMVARYFPHTAAFDYHVAVLEGARVVFTSDRALGRDAFRNPDVKTGIFQIRMEQMVKSLGATATQANGNAPTIVSDPKGGAWKLLLVHRAGSLDRAVAISRRRNEAIAFGIMLLLAVSMALVVVSTRRAQRLARQQMVFVAGVSHELRTPLSVIRSAGENLSDGVIAEPEQVRRYGGLIAQEGRRLSEMIEQVMAFAGFTSGRDITDRSKIEPARLIDDAVTACKPLLERHGFTLEQRVAAGLPAVNVNVAAMSQAIANLISNSVKYSGSSRWVGVTAEAAKTSHGTELRVTVADRGIGIRTEEQSHIFEPFFRGRDVVASTVRGSGLGLSLVKRIVEAHGGRLSVRSARGHGSAFTIHLPSEAAGRRVTGEVAGERV